VLVVPQAKLDPSAFKSSLRVRCLQDTYTTDAFHEAMTRSRGKLHASAL
jgi:hypothetical protein